MLLSAFCVYLVLLALSAAVSVAEASVLGVVPARLHRLVDGERRGARALFALGERTQHLHMTSRLLVCLTCGAGSLTGWLTGSAWGGAFTGITLALVGALLTYSVDQALPKMLAATDSEDVALSFARPALVTMNLIYPVARVIAGRVASPGGAAAGDASLRDEADEALIEAVSDFGEKVVREVMVPRTDMTAIEDSATVTEAVAMIASTGVSRIPIYHDTIDEVCGILYAKDLLVALLGDRNEPLSTLAREPYFIPETKPVRELLVEMRARTHIAIVADEYGGTAGLVTLEDLLEEIVGEISDEYDREEPRIIELGDGRIRVDARLPVDDLNEIFGTDLESEADSVGGLFTAVAGHIPVRGESIEFEGLRLTVTELEGTRIRRLCVESAMTGGRGDENEKSHTT